MINIEDRRRSPEGFVRRYIKYNDKYDHIYDGFYNIFGDDEDLEENGFYFLEMYVEDKLLSIYKDNEHKEIGRFLFDLKSDSFIFEDKDSKQYYTCGSKCRYLLFNLEGPAYIDKKDATNNRYHIDLYDEFENPTDKDMILKFAEQIKNERNS